MVSNPSMELLNLGHIVTLQSKLFAATTSIQSVVSDVVAMVCLMTCVSFRAISSIAAQSSELYRTSFSLTNGALVCTQSWRHVMDCRPQAFSSDHLKPSQPAISFRRFEWVGK